MTKKYNIVEKVEVPFYNKPLYRIESLKTFPLVSGGVVKKGELGGLIQGEHNLSQEGNAWIEKDAKVYGNARVYGNAWVFGNARVYENAEVYGNARVCNSAKIGGKSKVYGITKINIPVLVEDVELKNVNLDPKILIKTPEDLQKLLSFLYSVSTEKF